MSATDFKGSPDPEEPKNVAGLTTSGWTLVPKNEQIGRHWYVTHTDVVTTFYTQKSWLRPTSQAAYVLAHEQGHFDIMEIYARQLEKDLNARRFTIDEYNDLVPGIFKRAMHAAEAYQNQYDDNTSHGIHRTKQAEWLAEIKEKLTQ